MISQSAETRVLLHRVLELERTSADARDRAELLLGLQEALATIARTETPSEVITHVLRTVRAPLGFDRAILFEITRDHGIALHTVLDDHNLAPCSDEPSVVVVDDRTILDVLRNESGFAIGDATDLSSPLVDTRGWYVVARLPGTAEPNIVLYVDGHSSRESLPWHATLVSTLATIAGVAHGNAQILATTREAATRDPLTGLFNRRALMERGQSELDVARRDGEPLALALIDVDDFKSINDLSGHAEGDRTLQRLAAILCSGARATDIVARFAGDEFVVVLPRTLERDAEGRIGRLSRELRASGVRCSIGVALLEDDATLQELFDRADAALYETKRRGKDGYAFAASRRQGGYESEEPGAFASGSF